MESKKGKIGVNTALISLCIIVYSTVIRTAGLYTSRVAKQAGWLSPIVAGVVIIYLVSQLNTLLVQHPGLSLMEIYEGVTGKILTKIIAFIYLIWITLDTALNLRFYSVRLTSALYPNISEEFFIVITLIVTSVFIVKAGLVVASRMFIILFGITGVGFFILSGLMIPMISIEKLFPISYLDIIPIIKSSPVLIASWSFITIIFISSDNIIGMKEFKKRGIQTVLFLLFSTILLLVTMYGIISSAIIPRVSYAYLLGVEQINLLRSIQGLDSILILLWIFSDIALLSCLSLACLKLMKYIFNVQDASLYTYIFTIIVYYITILLADNRYQTVDFTYNYAMYMNIALYLFVPILMSWIYKIRSKATKALIKSNNAKKQA